MPIFLQPKPRIIPLQAAMQLHTKEGSPVDPVPFIIVALIGITVCFTFGPPYFRALGLSLPYGLGISTGLALIVSIAAYHRYVRTATPEQDSQIPLRYRLQRLYYAVFIGLVLIGLLALPLVFTLR